MTASHKPQDGLEVLLDALLEELVSMTDQQVLDGEDPATVQAKGLAKLSIAKQEAAKRRLAAAKVGVAMARADIHVGTDKPVTGAQAKAFIREAVNSGRYTLAARQLDEMSDEAALDIFNKLMRLGAQPTRESDDQL